MQEGFRSVKDLSAGGGGEGLPPTHELQALTEDIGGEEP